MGLRAGQGGLWGTEMMNHWRETRCSENAGWGLAGCSQAMFSISRRLHKVAKAASKETTTTPQLQQSGKPLKHSFFLSSHSLHTSFISKEDWEELPSLLEQMPLSHRKLPCHPRLSLPLKHELVLFFLLIHKGYFHTSSRKKVTSKKKKEKGKRQKPTAVA